MHAKINRSSPAPRPDVRTITLQVVASWCKCFIFFNKKNYTAVQ